MTLRLTEIHPSAVHLPIALAPASLALDALGLATGSKGMLNAGRILMGAAFAGAVAAGVTGVLAQGASKVEGEEANDLLTTHRTLNVTLTVLLGAMAAERAVVREPGRGYFALGVAALGAMGYSAYLGGRMSYEHGVGVARADGLRERAEIGRDSLYDVVEATVASIGRALQASWDDVLRGRFLPALRPGGRAGSSGRRCSRRRRRWRPSVRRAGFSAALAAPPGSGRGGWRRDRGGRRRPVVRRSRGSQGCRGVP